MSSVADKQRAHEIATNRTLVECVNTYLKAKAFASLERERVAPIQAELLRVWKPTATRNGRPGEPITNFDRLYLCEDDELCNDIFRDMDRMYREAGWKDLKPGECPALIAENLVTKAGWAVIEAARRWFPTVDCNSLLCLGLEKYRRYIDLLVGLVVNHPKYVRPSVAA